VPRKATGPGSLTSIARRATDTLVAALGTARTALGRQRPGVVRLDDVRRRLELLVTAVYDRPIPITVADAPKRRPWSFVRDLIGPPHLRRNAPLPTTDGERIQLPREIARGDAESALAEYRLMAIEQAERIARGTASRVPATATSVERDLYLLREGAVVDAAIARTVPGLRSALSAARALALSARPPLAALTVAERAVEGLLRESLGTDLTRPAARAGATTETPDDSLEWARQTMREVPAVQGKYRGIAPVAPWGSVRVSAAEHDAPLKPADDLAALRGSKFGVGQAGRGEGSGGKQSSQTGSDQGSTNVKQSGPVVPRADGPRRVAAGGTASERSDPHSGIDEAARATDTTRPESEQPETAVVPERRAEGARPARVRSRVPEPKPSGEGIEYPEWDWETGDYRSAGAVVRTHEPDVSDDRWGDAILARHGALVRRLRERFERLRARRARLTQQRDGDALDLSACVRALVDQRAGHGVDDRLYIAVRPARRGLAITLLIDISGSTDEWVDAQRRVIDVEKVALLLASEALDALGDLYSVLTFSGKGRANVRMRTIKAFDEANGKLVRRRVAALEPEGYTRAGAAIRHAAALLERQPAAHRLLLIISDGKPNDVDGYEGLSGVEDTRQAIIEARGQGVYPFCLTIDRQGQEYLGRIFGEAGHAVLRNAQQLPMALVKVVKHLLVS
jgi:nitric oxide reductase NorD protein